MTLMEDRFVRCFCKNATVCTRRPREYDQYAVCSKDCFAQLKARHPNILDILCAPLSR